MLETIAILVILVVTVREVVIGLVVWRKRSTISKKLRVEQTQSSFAEARNALMNLALNGQIDVNSVTFQALYKTNTMIMRRPDQYPEICKALVSTFLNRATGTASPEIAEESKAWSVGVKGVMLQTAKALDCIILEYSPLCRLFYKLDKRVDPASTPTRMLSKIAAAMAESNARKDPVVREIRDTQKEIYGLCAA